VKNFDNGISIGLSCFNLELTLTRMHLGLELERGGERERDSLLFDCRAGLHCCVSVKTCQSSRKLYNKKSQRARNEFEFIQLNKCLYCSARSGCLFYKQFLIYAFHNFNTVTMLIYRR
jgi:hypothetical protein